MAGSVEAAREALGVRLHELRQSARLTVRELGERAGWHFTKVSKVEHGRTMPSEDDLRLWCFHCDAEAQLPDLLATARGIEKMYAELRRLMRAGTARYQRELLVNEAAARRHRWFATFLVPGVLQTRAYATVRLTEFSAMTGTPDHDVRGAVDARMRRAELLRTDQLWHVVMCEPVLRSAMASGDVMREQLTHLLDASRLPRLRLGVIPAAVRHYSPLCEFWIRDDAVVEIETFSAAISITQPSEIAAYAQVFAHYASVAVYGDEARDLISRAMADFGQH